MPLCPYGVSVKPGSPTTYWITPADIQSWLPPEQYNRLAPWYWNLQEQLIEVGPLCAGDPPQPPEITDVDLISASADPISAILMAKRLHDYAIWWAWSKFCQCNGGSAVCVSTTVPSSISTNMTFWTPAQGYVWPTTSTGINPPTLVGNPYPWDASCATVDITCDTNPHVASFLMNPLYVYDDVGQVQEYTGYAGTTCTANLRTASGHANPNIHMIITTFDAGRNPNWNITIAPHAYTPPGPTAAPPPPITNVTVNVYNPPSCTSTADICSIIWNIKNYQTQIQNNTYLNTSPTTYATGNSYTVSGSGQQLVAQDTLGVVVQLSVLPPGLVATQTNPPRYYDVGYIQFGAADAIDGKKWIHSSGDRFIPAFPEVDRVHYNLSPGVTIVLTELVPPAPPSP